MSCTNSKVEDHSDYGSDFTPEEDGLLSQLLTKIEAKHVVATRTVSTVVVPTPSALVVPDIEDDAVLQALSVPGPKASHREELSSQVAGNSGSQTRTCILIVLFCFFFFFFLLE
jgi:hypothetical protein